MPERRPYPRRTRITFSDARLHVLLAATKFARDHGFDETVSGSDLRSLDEVTDLIQRTWAPVAHHNLMRMMGFDDAVMLAPDSFKRGGKYAREEA